MYLYETGFLESGEGTVLFDGAEAAGRDIDDDGLFEFWHVHALFLHIRVLSNSAARIELRRTSPVGIAAADDRSLIGDCAYFSHKSDVDRMLS